MISPLRLLLLPALTLVFAAGLAAQDHGDKPEKSDKPDKKAAGDKVDFVSQILPILEKNCVDCHKAPYTGPDGKPRRPKGGVMFDSKDGMMASKKGKLVIAKKPDDSKLIAAISLPADDEDRMPPAKKGDPLSKEQIDLLRKWIEQGADFGTWVGAKDAGKGKDGKTDGKGKEPKGGKDDKGHGGDKGHGEEFVEQLSAGLAPLDDAAMERLCRSAHVETVEPGCALLRVSFQGAEGRIDDAALEQLAPAREHIGELVLARTRITDAAMAQLAAYPRLYHVDLRQTAVGDRGVQALAELSQLRSLNLFGTQVGDAGLAALAATARLRELYVWQTPVSAGAVVALQRELPRARIVFSADLPEPLADDATRGRGRRGNR